MRIAFIGGGSMAEAMIRGLLDKGIVSADYILASDVSSERRDLLEKSYGVRTASDNLSVVTEADVVVLAVKPNSFGQVLPELEGHLRPEQLVLSIAAGVTIATISGGLNHKAVVRSMPNMSAQIGEGITVWTATEAVSEQQKEAACSILSSLGTEVYVTEEKYLDMATAVSGSGPGFLLLVMEALVEAGVQVGFSHEVAKDLVLQTTLGTVLLAQKSEKGLAELRGRVTSPGGTTAAGLHQLEQGDLWSVLVNAVIAAHERAKELGRGG